MARTLLLDLDGTLVDSVPDLCAALNRLLQSRATAGLSYIETAAMVGDGAEALVGRAFAARGMRPDSTALDDFLRDYGVHSAVETRAYPGVGTTLDALTAAGVRVVYVESPQTAHEWQTWRRALYDFAPRLFRQERKGGAAPANQ